MNAEMSKIRKLRNYNEVIKRDYSRIKDDRMNEIIIQLNTNMSELYQMKNNENIDINDFAKLFIANIYIVLNAFNEMGVYPDYFYDEIVKMNVEYRKIVENNNNIRGNYRLFNEINLSARLSEAMQRGLKNGYHHIQAYQTKDINDAFVEMIGLFQAFNIPYNISTTERCLKVFNEIYFNHTNIIEHLQISDYDSDDVECFSRLLFEYLTFFVSVGINPKELLDKYIEEHALEDKIQHHK